MNRPKTSQMFIDEFVKMVDSQDALKKQIQAFKIENQYLLARLKKADEEVSRLKGGRYSNESF